MAELVAAPQMPSTHTHLRPQPLCRARLELLQGRLIAGKISRTAPKARPFGTAERHERAPGIGEPAVLLTGEQGEGCLARLPLDPDHHELALGGAFRLEPGGRPATAVAARRLLRDDPFQAHSVCGREERGGIAVEFLAERDTALTLAAELLQLRPTLDERSAAQVSPVQVKQVEGPAGGSDTSVGI